MSLIVIYDPLNDVVSGRVTGVIPSANTPDWDSQPNKLVNPDLSAVGTVPQQYWKVEESSVVPMLSSERLAYDAAYPAPTESKTKEQILTAMKGDFTSMEQARRIMAAARKYVDFGWCLDNFDYTGAYNCIIEAHTAGDIDTTDANFLIAHIPTHETDLI